MKDVNEQINKENYNKLKRLNYLTVNQLKSRLALKKKKLARLEYNLRLEKRYGINNPFFDIRPQLKHEITLIEKVMENKT